MNQEEILLQQGMDCLRQNDYDGAFSNFLQAAQLGYPVAMNNLSVCYAKGYGTPVNRVEAFRWMKEAAERGYSPSYYPLANKYRLGDGTPMDLETALLWAKRALQDAPEERTQAQQLIDELTKLISSKEGQQALSALDQGIQHYVSGRYQEAFATFKAEAENGVPAAMHNLSVCYINGQGVPADPAAAFRWMKAAAENGFTASYYPLAYKYHSGTGTTADPAQALFWARKAAEVSNDQQAKAQDLVRQLESADDERRFQQGVQDYRTGRQDEAFATFKELAEKGLLAAMFNLSVCYGRGAGTAKDPQAAFFWLTKSAEGGYNLAMHNLAVAYSTGEGTPKDQQAAFRWMKASAEAGDTSSYYPLACKYAFGTGTPVDLVQALAWAREAAQVTDDQQAKAQGLVKQLESDPRLQQAMQEMEESDRDFDDERSI